MGVEVLQISVGSFKWVADTIDNEVMGINAMGTGIANIMGKAEIYDKLIASIPQEMKSAIAGVALTLIALFLLLDFIKKSTDLKWVTWENVLMFFLKFIIAKVCVDNSEWLMSCIYNGFNSLTDMGLMVTEIIPWNGDNKALRYQFFLSGADAGKLISPPSIMWYDFTPVGLWLMVIVQSFLMKAIVAVTFIIVLARFMELTIYTIAAPLPLATFGSDGLQDIGKSYLKSYAACCIHAMVILLIFASYGALNTALSAYPNAMNSIGAGGIMGLIKTFILGATIMKSEQWAKRICGAI